MKLVLFVGLSLTLLQQGVDGYHTYYENHGLRYVKHSPIYDFKPFDDTCNETSSNGIGLMNGLLHACNYEITENTTCDSCLGSDFRSKIMDYPEESFNFFFDQCYSNCPRSLLSKCHIDCSEIYLKVLCFYELDQLKKLKKASIESLTLEETEAFIKILDPEYGVCGHGRVPKLIELKCRNKILQGYEKDCLNDLAKQCEMATNHKKTNISMSCYDGKVKLELSKQLLDNSHAFCVWHGYIAREDRSKGREKICYECSNKRAGCSRIKC